MYKHIVAAIGDDKMLHSNEKCYKQIVANKKKLIKSVPDANNQGMTITGCLLGLGGLESSLSAIHWN